MKDFTFNISKNIANYISIFDISRDKDSSIVIMERLDHIQKLETMINDGMKEGISILEGSSILGLLKEELGRLRALKTYMISL